MKMYKVHMQIHTFDGVVESEEFFFQSDLEGDALDSAVAKYAEYQYGGDVIVLEEVDYEVDDFVDGNNWYYTEEPVAAGESGGYMGHASYDYIVVNGATGERRLLEDCILADVSGMTPEEFAALPLV